MSNAALQAGLAFSQTQTALAHALSYDLTLQLGLPHGLACAVWLPRTWALAKGRDPDRDALLAQVFGAGVDGPAALSKWLDALQVQPLSAYVQDSDVRIERALHHPRGRNFIGAPHDALV
jgi:alcohol dehydrogenase class IV